MDNMSPQQQQDSLCRGGGQQENKRVGLYFKHFYQCSQSLFTLMGSCGFKSLTCKLSTQRSLSPDHTVYKKYEEIVIFAFLFKLQYEWRVRG